jgi:hypothetical protein
MGQASTSKLRCAEASTQLAFESRKVTADEPTTRWKQRKEDRLVEIPAALECFARRFRVLPKRMIAEVKNFPGLAQVAPPLTVVLGPFFESKSHPWPFQRITTEPAPGLRPRSPRRDERCRESFPIEGRTSTQRRRRKLRS